MSDKSPTLLGLFLLMLTIFSISSCGIVRSLTLLAPNFEDYRHDPQAKIEAPEKSFHFLEGEDQTSLGDQVEIVGAGEERINLSSFVRQFDTRAFLIIRNDTILYEQYPGSEDIQVPVSSFSISKAVITTLVGVAIKEKYIKNTDQFVWEFLPEWKEKGFEKLKISHLMEHSSGMNFSKSIYNPASDQVQFYYGRNLLRRIRKRKPERPPGEAYDYQSANTILLTMVLEKATGMSISRYLERSIWTPLEMEAPASWSLDRRGQKGLARTFCCLQAMARDFAKLGRLWMNDGQWQGRQLLVPGYISELLQRNGVSRRYRSGFRIIEGQTDIFYTSGLLGQYIYMFPRQNLMILRFGEHKERYTGRMWRSVFMQIASQL